MKGFLKTYLLDPFYQNEKKINDHHSYGFCYSGQPPVAFEVKHIFYQQLILKEKVLRLVFDQSKVSF